jgi:hypothetical protein
VTSWVSIADVPYSKLNLLNQNTQNQNTQNQNTLENNMKTNTEYKKPEVIELGDAVKVTLGILRRRRDFLGINRRRSLF